MAFDLGDIGKMAGDTKDLAALPGMWDDVKDKDWHGFYERIETAKNNHEGDAGQLDKLKGAGQQAASEGTSFPQSLPEFTKVISEHMPH